jgi:hypothetical protein
MTIIVYNMNLNTTVFFHSHYIMGGTDVHSITSNAMGSKLTWKTDSLMNMDNVKYKFSCKKHNEF